MTERERLILRNWPCDYGGWQAKIWCPSSKVIKQENLLLKRESAFCSSQFSHRLDEARPHWGGQSALLSLPIKIFIFSKITLTGTPRIMFEPMTGHHGQSSQHIKLIVPVVGSKDSRSESGGPAPLCFWPSLLADLSGPPFPCLSRWNEASEPLCQL